MRIRKKLGIFRLFAAVLILTLTVMLAVPAQAATVGQIEEAVVKGLAWLADQQQPDGSWQYSGSSNPETDVAATSLVVLKFEERAKQLGLDPFNPAEYEYAQNVIDGLDYIFAHAIEDGIGVHFGFYDVYDTGMAMMAVAASDAPGRVITTGPLNGQAYQYALEGMMAAIAYGQNTSGPETGGWGYDIPYPGWSDQSNAGYATLGIGFAAAPAPIGFGLAIPAGVLTYLNAWIDDSQVDAGPYAGGSAYWLSGGYSWVNIYKTGTLLQQLALVGDPVGSPRVQAAIGFIETYWYNVAGVSDGAGWMGNYQAMFTLMKGLQSYDIDTLSIGDWFDQVSDYIIASAIKPDADHWYWESTAEEPSHVPVMDTAWALLTLEKVAPPGALALLPPTASNPVDTQHTVTAFYQIAGDPVAGVEIDFEVISGPNTGEADVDFTGGDGKASFTYTGSGGPGTDTIKATAVDQAGAPLASAEATKTWTEEGPGPVEVGGTIYPADKLTMLAPWILLAAAMIAGTTIAVKRRRVRS